MTDLKAAVSEYLTREAAGDRRPEGIDRTELMETVAVEYGIDCDVLTEAVLSETVLGAN